jgi:predicted transcriptional regulator
MLFFVIFHRTLTCSHTPPDTRGLKKLPSFARLTHIRERLADQSSVSISELAKTFGVSKMIVRRDLFALEEQTQVQRTHGGAVLTERMILEFNYRERRETNRAAKNHMTSRVTDNFSTLNWGRVDLSRVPHLPVPTARAAVEALARPLHETFDGCPSQP